MNPSEIIRKYGWCQGHYEDADGRCCLIGAINKYCLTLDFPPAIESSNLMSEKYPMAHHVAKILDIANRKVGEPLNWNECEGRTQQEVVTLLQEIEVENPELFKG